GQERLCPRQVLSRGDLIRNVRRRDCGGRGVDRGDGLAFTRTRRGIRGPAPNADAEQQHGGGRDGPAHPGAKLDHVLIPTRVFDPLPHLLAWRGAWCVVRGTGRVLQPLLKLRVFVLVHHAIHSPATSDSATRNLARARASCAFDVPVSTPNATPISSCV